MKARKGKLSSRSHVFKDCQPLKELKLVSVHFSTSKAKWIRNRHNR